MSRVTSTEVKAIITTSKTTTQVDAYIAAATALVDKHLDDSSLDVGDDLLKEIERWLAAHFVAIDDQRKQSEEVLSAKDTYQVSLGLNLQSTMYGQQVLVLDPTGKLAALAKPKRTIRLEAIVPVSTIR